MYNEKYQQKGNACGAATLMIALYELCGGKVNSAIEEKLFEQTRDPVLSKLLGVPEKETENYFSSPANIQSAAKSHGLIASLFVHEDVELPEDVAPLKAAYVDALKPSEVDTAGLKKLLDKGPLQLLVYTDSKVKAMHWLLLHKAENGGVFVYDTAYGTNTKVDPDAILAFNAAFQTSRQNNFLGAAFLLQHA